MAFQNSDKILVNRDGVDYQADIGPLMGGGGGGDDSTKVSKIDTNDQNVVSRLTIGTNPVLQGIFLNTDGSIRASADATIHGMTVGRGGGFVLSNTAVGKEALLNNEDGDGNTAVGRAALKYNTTGLSCVAIGEEALRENTEGWYNVAVGPYALCLNTTARENTAVGQYALYANRTGDYNTAVGKDALTDNTTGEKNTAVGRRAMSNNITGEKNTAVGEYALDKSTAGNYNVALGVQALHENRTGSGNIVIGGLNTYGQPSPVFNIQTEDNRIVMGSNYVTNAYINVAWEVTSDARDKTNFAPVPHGLDFIKQLQPIQYEFRVDRDSEEVNGPIHYGFKAQDILALEGDNPVIIDNEDPDHLKYKGEHLVPVLVNAIKEQQVLIDALTARLDAAGA